VIKSSILSACFFLFHNFEFILPASFCRAFFAPQERRQLANQANPVHDLVNRMKAIVNQKTAVSEAIVADPEILGGEPVFRGTRVPVASLFEHLESDCSLDEFLENFPTVSRAAAVAVLMGAQELAIDKSRFSN
jgi:uncharacterized protein (DUF433 family)